ncbi:nitrous oxide reductase family maturation protein NosD [Paenibacillus sp. EPM92]|uniref:right-handed parallel beta-helix repeat-containing protein n=1 Tax=Paenibacillus sp. EPM92 TaxID=1561195 RepID=UPI001916B8A1|nr:right-handed parallel beta-helix repeat-containing protein [Paenibacillus sp. EPM92]
MPSDSSSKQQTWSRRKLLAAIGTGAAGLMLGGSASFERTASAAAPLPSAAGPWLNVKDYGAKGGGLVFENDAPAIQAAINAAGSSRFGGTVYVPPGRYIIDAPLFLYSNVRLIGDGPVSSVIKSNRSSMVMVQGAKLKQSSVERLGFEGSGSLTGRNDLQTEKAIALTECEQAIVRDCAFQAVANGVWLTGCRETTVVGCSFIRLYSSESLYEGYGIVAEAGEKLGLVDNRFQQLDKPCIYVSGGCSHSTIAGNTAEACKESLITVTSPLKACSHLRIEGNTVTSTGLAAGEKSCRHGIVLRHYCTDNVIADNRIAGASAAGIWLEGDGAAEAERPKSNLIAGNRIVDSPKGIALLNSDANTVSGNDVRRTKVGIELDTSGEKSGSVCRDNVITGNTVFRCTEAGIRLATQRCEANAVFGNGGSANGEALADAGKGTIRSGF